MARVLYLLPQPFLLSRGSSFRAYATIKAILKAGYQVDLLSYPLGELPADLAKADRVRVYRSSSVFPVSSIKIGPSFKKIYLDIFFYLKAKSLVSKNDYALIHGVEEAGLMAHRLSKRTKVPFVYDMHSWMSQQIEEGGFSSSKILLSKFKNLEDSAIKASGAIITVGEVMSEILDQNLDTKKTYTLHDCPLSFDLEIADELKQDIIDQFFLDPQIKKIVYTGNFHKYQGIDLLFAAIAELKKLCAEGQTFQLLLVGGGKGDKDNIKYYQQMTRDLDVEDQVVFCGQYPAEAMPVFMQNADLLVSSRTQGNNVPLKVYTYLAAGNLLLATNISSHVQVLNNSNSILSNPNSTDFSEAIFKALFKLSEQEKNQIIDAAQSIGTETQINKFNSVVAECYSSILG